jgi:hypothetical protein
MPCIPATTAFSAGRNGDCPFPFVEEDKDKVKAREGEEVEERLRPKCVIAPPVRGLPPHVEFISRGESNGEGRRIRGVASFDSKA